MLIDQKLKRVLEDMFLEFHYIERRKNGWTTISEATHYGITAVNPIFDMKKVAAALLEHHRAVANMGFMSRQIVTPQPAAALRGGTVAGFSTSAAGVCEFRFNPATDSDMKPAGVPI